MNTGIIILAAGNSSRLGRPKQLLTFGSKTLLSIVMDEALKTSYKPILVVTGAHATEITEKHRSSGVLYVHNPDWESGMASSIVKGIGAILDINSNLDNIILAVADQVMIHAKIFEKLQEKHQLTGKEIIACSYSETIGTPVLFNKKYFGKLLQLRGEAGAKKLLLQYPSDIELIKFENGEIDIDTEADYKNLISKQ